MAQPLFTKAQLLELCKGDVDKLPLFIVWQPGFWSAHAQPDNQGRIHIARRDFEQHVLGFWPVKVLEPFTEFGVLVKLDLQPHDLQGGDLAPGKRGNKQEVVRELAGMDPKTGKPKWLN